MREDLQLDEYSWWIDYMEGDIDVRHRLAMEAILRHSLVDRLIVENFRILREKIRIAGQPEVPGTDLYYQDLQQKIMNQIMVPPSETPRARPRGANPT